MHATRYCRPLVASAGGSVMEGLLSDAVAAYAHLRTILASASRPKALVVTNSWGMFHPSWDYPVGHRGNFSDNLNHPFNVIIRTLERKGAEHFVCRRQLWKRVSRRSMWWRHQRNLRRQLTSQGLIHRRRGYESRTGRIFHEGPRTINPRKARSCRLYPFQRFRCVSCRRRDFRCHAGSSRSDCGP